jgi:hypothetical protein
VAGVLVEEHAAELDRALAQLEQLLQEL